MTFAEKLKNIRKQAGMSQEQLAEKIGVSRQAVTKWETGTGIPDIENIKSISALSGVSIDELLSEEGLRAEKADFLYESVTEYDIDGRKDYDIKLGGASRLVIRGYDGEKLRVRLASNTLATIQSDFKVKIDDVKNRIDVDVTRKNDITEATAKEALTIFLTLPTPYLGKIEAAINAEAVEIASLECESVELDAKISRLTLDGVKGTVEVNCNLDMTIDCLTLNGSVEINQLSATSRINVPKDAAFTARVKGVGTTVSYEKGGKPAEPFAADGAENVIELNGMKSELIVCAAE
ncbi:MAG: helix-turn-helix domain-containing protein [Bacteroides sp.]|nr:helix-turn-helix domain-containing protein [Eubacterium sp.]MCM1417671.1 helix-turn-helix domain-containing protein [Roseburia sp.]MCM1461863.1 helix-turn-helix domain-containing protein [Bacteroides sp.]